MTANESVTIRRAREADLPYLAAMHIPPASQATMRKRILEGGHWFNFYLDKMRILYRLEREGLLVAEDASGLTGFCMVSRDLGKLKSRALTSGMALSMVVNAVCMRYGMNSAFLMKVVRLLIALATSRALRIDKRKRATSLFHRMHKAIIYSWVVVAEKRGRGIGHSLLEAACNYLRAGGAGKVGVMTLQDNVPMLQLYERLGFAKVATRIESVGKVFYLVKNLGELADAASSAVEKAARRDVIPEEGVLVRPATIDEVPFVAALHIDPPMRSRGREIIRQGGKQYNFYLDKVMLYHRLEPEGLLVAVDREGIGGFCITSRSAARLKNRALRSGIAISLILKALNLRYGLSPAFVLKAVLIFLSTYGVRAIRTSGSTSRAPLFYTLHGPKIWAFVVATEYRGKGVGQALLESACDYLRRGGCKRIAVMVRRDSHAAVKAYARAGFEIVAKYIENVGRVYYMVRNL